MRPTDAQFSIVDRLAGEGQISDEEHDDLTHGVISPESPEVDEAEEARPTPASDETDQPVTPSFPRPTLRTDLSVNFVGGVGILAIGLIVLSSLNILSWVFTIGGIVLLATTLFDGMRWATVAGTAALTVVAVIGLAGIGRDDPSPNQAPPDTLAPEDPDPVAAAGSLGIQMDEVTEAWNTVDGPPTIARGLTRYNESGEYDTFIYRFGEWGRLAGAYDPGNDAIYALLAAGWLSQDATDQLYLRLCFMVAPYSQECVDSYFEHGLEGGTLDDFADETHEAEWLVGDHTWRLEIDQNVLTIRVFGADAA